MTETPLAPLAAIAQLRSQLTALNWQAPWWQPWRELGMAVSEIVMAGHSVSRALNGFTSPVRFVPQSELPASLAYEAFIFESRQVPTRDNLHDFFNGLAWLKFPRIKQRLNALQYAEIQNAGVQATRGTVRDALTLFDENAAFLNPATQMPLIEALKARDWQAAFQTHRALWHKPPVLFGHALLEKLVAPYKAMTAHVLTLNFSSQSDWDVEISNALDASALRCKPFAPLPVLGVPRWWPANEQPDFYTDTKVFRLPQP